MKDYILARAKEPSTWRGLILVLTAAGVPIAPAMAESIISLKSDQARCKEMARRGMAFVRANYDRQAIADKYLKVLASLARTGKGG